MLSCSRVCREWLGAFDMVALPGPPGPVRGGEEENASQRALGQQSTDPKVGCPGQGGSWYYTIINSSKIKNDFASRSCPYTSSNCEISVLLPKGLSEFVWWTIQRKSSRAHENCW